MRKKVDIPYQLDRDALAERLRRHKLTYDDVAAKLKVKRWRVESWANGGDIQPEQLYYLSCLFHCNMNALIRKDDVP